MAWTFSTAVGATSSSAASEKPHLLKALPERPAVQNKGMAAFSHLLNDEDVENIRAYFLKAAAGPAAAAPTVPQHAQ